MTIGRKLTVAVLVLLGAVVVQSYFGFRSASGLGGALELAVNTRTKEIEAAGALRTDFEQMAAASRAAQISMVIDLLEQRETKSGRAGGMDGQCAACHDRGTVETAVTQFRAAASNAQARAAALRRWVDGEGERRALDVTESGLRAWVSQFDE